MKRKALGLSAALLFWLLCQAVPVYRVHLDGEALAGGFSPAQLRLAEACARDAAEELCGAEAALPALSYSLRLGLRPTADGARRLSDALLRGTAGVAAADSVSVNGLALGTVRDGAALLDALRESIRAGMPAGAAVGNLGGALRIAPVYTRAGTEIEAADMLRTVTALAPVFYLDAEGTAVTVG